ncbi:MAG: hypothetical protein R3F61_38105 [Myxococcota bacterium]
MKYAHLALLAGAVGLTLACDGAPKDGDTDPCALDTFDPACHDDTDVEEVPAPLIQLIDPSGCNGAGSAFEFGIENSGWADLAVLTIWDTSFDPTFDEEHVMEYVTSGQDENGYWDQWSVSLTDEATLAGQVPGQSTVFNCDNEAFLTYAIEVFTNASDANSNDCAVFGDDPSALINGTWPNGAANPNGTTIGNRFANCINFNQ